MQTDSFSNITDFLSYSQVRYDNDPESALIQFSSPAEAKAAHDCVEAVLNNRFIKVYYLKKGAQGQWTGKKVETTTNVRGRMVDCLQSVVVSSS